MGDDDSFAQDKPVKKRKSPAVKKTVKKQVAAKKVAMKDQGCQTSPGFVKAAKAARRKNVKKVEPKVENVEMDEFVEKAVSAAKKAVKKSPKKSPAKKAKDQNGNGAAAISNPTPAMLALMAKKAENSAAKKPRNKK